MSPRRGRDWGLDITLGVVFLMWVAIAVLETLTFLGSR
jgi:hypothetical protein